jgi:hypothetical protein
MRPCASLTQIGERASHYKTATVALQAGSIKKPQQTQLSEGDGTEGRLSRRVTLAG